MLGSDSGEVDRMVEFVGVGEQLLGYFKNGINVVVQPFEHPIFNIY